MTRLPASERIVLENCENAESVWGPEREEIFHLSSGVEFLIARPLIAETGSQFGAASKLRSCS